MSMAASARSSTQAASGAWRTRCPSKKFKSKEYPMIELRPFAKLGGADHGWLKAKHHFSFGSHYDPGNMGHGSLRVWNDDEIAPNTGFPAHPHANMEIITYVREGAITHQDSLGNKGRTEAGDVQVKRRIRGASLRIQSGADQDQNLPDLDRADHRRRPADLGR